jgi:hypothetical protein
MVSLNVKMRWHAGRQLPSFGTKDYCVQKDWDPRDSDELGFYLGSYSDHSLLISLNCSHPKTHQSMEDVC